MSEAAGAAAPVSEPVSSRLGVTGRELAVVIAVVVGAIGIFLTTYDPGILGRPFWLDEQCCTVYAVQDARSFFDLFGLVRRYDVGPPLMHMIVWVVTRIVGSTDPWVVRSVGLVAMLTGMVLVYVIVRRRFGIAASAAATLAVATNTLVLSHSFDARFYGLWVLFGAAYVCVLGADAGRPSRRRDLGIAAASIAVCSIHWFGVISLVLMATGAVAAHGRQWRSGLRLVAPSVAGLVVFALLSPMMFTQLRSGGEAIRWVPPLSKSHVWVMSRFYVLRLPLLVTIFTLLAVGLRSGGIGARIRELLRDPALAGMIAPIVMPLTLIAITLLLDPVMVPRYAILAALAPAPFVALAADSLGRKARGFFVAYYVVALVALADKEAMRVEYKAGLANLYRSQFATLKAENPRIPIVFQSNFVFYDVEGHKRQRAEGRLLLVPDSLLASFYPRPENRVTQWEALRETKGVLNHNRVFGFPLFVTHAELDSTPMFVLMTTDSDLPPLWRSVTQWGAKMFPRHTPIRLSGAATLFMRVTPPAPGERR